LLQLFPSILLEVTSIDSPNSVRDYSFALVEHEMLFLLSTKTKAKKGVKHEKR